MICGCSSFSIPRSGDFYVPAVARHLSISTNCLMNWSTDLKLRSSAFSTRPWRLSWAFLPYFHSLQIRWLIHTKPSISSSILNPSLTTLLIWVTESCMNCNYWEFTHFLLLIVDHLFLNRWTPLPHTHPGAKVTFQFQEVERIINIVCGEMSRLPLKEIFFLRKILLQLVILMVSFTY